MTFGSAARWTSEIAETARLRSSRRRSASDILRPVFRSADRILARHHGARRRIASLLALVTTGVLLAGHAGAGTGEAPRAASSPDPRPGVGWSTSDGRWLFTPTTSRPDWPQPEGFWDAPRDRYVLFASNYPPNGNEVWVLPEGESWSKLETVGPAPPEQTYYRVVFDTKRDHMIVIRGNRIWTLTLTGKPTWTETVVNGSISLDIGAIYDPLRDRIVAYGWSALAVWTLDLGQTPEWLQATTLTAALPRAPSTLIYDSYRDRIVIYGSDPWAVQLNTMFPSRLPPNSPAPPLEGSSAIFDPLTRDVLIVGGKDDSQVRDEVWRWSLETYSWSLDQPALKAPARYYRCVGFDPARRRMLVFDGTEQQGYASGSDDWEYAIDSKVWSKLEVCGVRPTATITTYVSWAFDSRRRQPMLFINGGTNFPKVQLWTYPPDSGHWCEIATHGARPSGGRAVYDSLADRVLCIGEGKVWALSLGDSLTWTEFPTAGTPTSTFGHALVMDLVQNRVLMFGGFGLVNPPPSPGSVSELWELRLGTAPPSWHQIPVTVPPYVGGRTVPGLAYDPVSKRLAIWGGVVYYGGTSYHDRTGYITDLDDANPTWVPLPNPNAPNDAPATGQLVLDSERRRFVLHGGYDAYHSAVWSLPVDGPLAWTHLEPVGSPPPAGYLEDYTLAAYDPEQDELDVFTADGRWRLSWNDSQTPTRPTIEWIEARRERGRVSIQWRTDVADFVEARVERFDAASWTPVGTAVTANGVGPLTFEDRNVADGRDYRYRLRLVRAAGDVVSEERTLSALSLSGRLTVVPLKNPADGIRIELALPTSERVHFEVLDVAGRVVARHDMASPAGTTQLDWRETQTLPTGVYLVRATQSGTTALTRVVLVR
jgi:hypothetical protein